MRNITGQAVVGDDLYGREYELDQIWDRLEHGEHILMLAPRRVGKTSLMLELQHAPRGEWDVVYVDVEGGNGPEEFVAAILATLAARPEYRSRLEAIPFAGAIRDALRHLSASVESGPLRIELKHAIGRDWGQALEQLWMRLACLPDAGRVLVIVDELPILVARMLRTGGRECDANLLLSRLRKLRQSPEWRGKICTLIGGSIGLEGILRRAGFSGLINDLSPFHLDSWNRSTAAECLRSLGRGYAFPLDDVSIEGVLDLLGDPVPYHVQLFFSALRDTCRGDATRVSLEGVEHCFADRLAGPSGTAHLDHYATRLETAFNETEFRIAQGILGCVCRRRRGASFAELNGAVRSDTWELASVLRDLEADGYLRRSDGRLEFRSNLLREWWRKHHGRESVP